MGERDTVTNFLAHGAFEEHWNYESVRNERLELSAYAPERSAKEWEKLESEARKQDRDISILMAEMLILKDQELPLSVVAFDDLRAFTFKMSAIDSDLMKHVVAVRGDYKLEEPKYSYPEGEDWTAFLKKREKMIVRMKSVPKGSPALQWEDHGCELEK